MTGIRKALGLEEYIGLRQYRNLGLLFLTMNALWFYFTYAENLGIAAGQQPEEFVVLAAKLWGEFAPTFWLMILMMVAAFWILVVPKLLPASVERAAVFQPRVAFASVGAAVILFALVSLSPRTPALAALSTANSLTLAWAAIIALLIFAALGVTFWLKAHPVASATIAGGIVLVGMWLERWNIILPTVTHPRLIPYAAYFPSLTEGLVTLGSLALFVMMFVVFFKFFPAVSIWEVAEGRVIEAAQSKNIMPAPEPSKTGLLRPRKFKL